MNKYPYRYFLSCCCSVVLDCTWLRALNFKPRHSCRWVGIKLFKGPSHGQSEIPILFLLVIYSNKPKGKGGGGLLREGNGGGHNFNIQIAHNKGKRDLETKTQKCQKM